MIGKFDTRNNPLALSPAFGALSATSCLSCREGVLSADDGLEVMLGIPKTEGGHPKSKSETEKPKQRRAQRRSLRTAEKQSRKAQARAAAAQAAAAKPKKTPARPKSAATTKRKRKASDAPVSSTGSGRGTVKKPKRPKTAYNFFQLAIRKQLWEELAPEIKGPKDRVHCNEKIARVIGRRWKALSAPARSTYQTMADRDKQRYLAENDQYIAKLRSRFAKPNEDDSTTTDELRDTDEDPEATPPKSPVVEKLKPKKESKERKKGVEINKKPPQIVIGGVPQSLENLMSPPALKSRLFGEKAWELAIEPRQPPVQLVGDTTGEEIEGLPDEIADVHDVLREFEWGGWQVQSL